MDDVEKILDEIVEIEQVEEKKKVEKPEKKLVTVKLLSGLRKNKVLVMNTKNGQQRWVRLDQITNNKIDEVQFLSSEKPFWVKE